MRELPTEEIAEATVYWGTWKEEMNQVDTPTFVTEDIILAQDMALSKKPDGSTHEFGYVYTVRLENAKVQRPDRRRIILRSYQTAEITEKLTLERNEGGLPKRISRSSY